MTAVIVALFILAMLATMAVCCALAWMPEHRPFRRTMQARRQTRVTAVDDRSGHRLMADAWDEQFIAAAQAAPLPHDHTEGTAL